MGIERLVIVGGEFQLDHARVPLDLDLPGFRGRLESRPEGGVAGHVSFGPGTMRFGGAPLMPLGTEIDLVIHRGLLTVEGARLIGERINLAWRGRLRLGRDPRGQFRLEGPVDLAVLERHVFRSGLGFAGTAEWNGLVSIDGPRLRIEGLVEGAGGLFRGAAVPRFRSWLSYDGTEGLVMRDLDLEAFGGKARLAIDVPPTRTNRPVHVRGTVAGVDGEGVLGMLFGWGRMGIGTAATGPVDVRWPKGRNRLVSGRVDVDLAERADGLGLLLAGRLEWSAVDGVETWEAADLRMPVMSGRASGRIEADDRAELRVDGETTTSGDRRPSSPASAGDWATPKPSPPVSAGGARSAAGGSGRRRIRSSRAASPAPGVCYADVDWGAAEWAGRFDTAAESVESRSLVLRKEGGELWWDGRAEIGWYGLRDAVDGNVRLRRWPVADIVKFMSWDIQATGTLSGEAHVAGRRSAPRGEARVVAQAGRYYGVAYDKAEIDARFRDRVTEVTSGELRLGGGGISFRGRLTDDGVYDGTAEMREVDLGALVPAGGEALAGGLSGPVSGHLVLQGTLTRPRLRARVSSPRVFFGDEGIGALEATLTGAGEGRISLEARCRSGRVDLALEGSVGALPPYEARLRLVARDTSVDPFLRAFQPSLPGVLTLVASGEMRVDGPLASPAQLRVEAEAPDVRLLLPDYPIQAREPVRLTLADGELRLADFHLAGEGTDLAVTGGVDLLGDGPLAVSARGRADLRALSLVTRRLRGLGAARLAIDLTGTGASLTSSGASTSRAPACGCGGFPTASRA